MDVELRNSLLLFILRVEVDIVKNRISQARSTASISGIIRVLWSTRPLLSIIGTATTVLPFGIGEN